jgi:PAS domain S-box-containing protein
MTRQTLLTLVADLNDAAIDKLAQYAAALAELPRHRRTDSTPPLRLVATRPALPTLLEQPKGAYFVTTRGGQNVHASQELAQWLGTDRKRLLQDDWLAFVDGHDEQRRVAEKWLNAAQTTEGFTMTVRCRTAQGGTVYAFVRVRPCFHPIAGTLEGFLGTVHPQVIPARFTQADTEVSA